MKYRIVEKYKASITGALVKVYAVQYKYKYWPFWLFDKEPLPSADFKTSEIITYSRPERAEERIYKLKKIEEAKKDNWKVYD